MRIRFSAVRALLAIGLLTGLSGCILTHPNIPSSLENVGGGLQTVAPNATAPKALTVVVKNQDREPMENITILWEIKSGAGTLSATETSTNDDGISSITFTAGPTAGKTVVLARVTELAAAVSYTITVQ